MSQHTLLILGSMDEFVCLVDDARARGYRTIVIDGYPAGPAKPYADLSFDIAVDDTQALRRVCEEQGVDGMITAFSDLLFENMVKLSVASSIPCYGNYAGMQWLRSKTKMKEMFRMLDVPHPKSALLRHVDDLQEMPLQFPCVMKPRDGYGSRGIFVVEDEDEVRARFDETLSFCLNEEGVLLEEYCADHEFNMISWIADGRAHVVSIADREKSHEIAGDIPHVSRLVYPSRFWSHVVDEALAIVQKVALFTGIQNGPLCMQFFWSPEAGIRVCETAGRVFGYEHELVEQGCGLRIEDLLLDTVYDKGSLKERLEHHGLDDFKGACAGLYFHGREKRMGSRDHAVQLLEAQGDVIDEALWYYQPGDEISHGRGAKPYLLRVYLHEDDLSALDALTRHLFAELHVEDDAGDDILYHNEVPGHPSS